MLIEEKVLNHWIDNFYGYGSWHAPIWFIGYEESGGDVPEEVAEKINYFYKGTSKNLLFSSSPPAPLQGETGAVEEVFGSPLEVHAPTNATLCDIRELYRQVAVRRDDPKAGLFPNRCEYRFGINAVQNGVWKNLIAFQYGYRNEKLPDLLEYQKHIFASPSTYNEALIRLYPLPGPHSHAWYYSWLDLPQLPFLKSRALYQEYVYQRRIHTILSNICEYKPEVVLMYGMNNINALKKSVQQFFHGDKFKMIKGTKQQIPQHHRTDIDGTTILITTQFPTLRHNRIETGFDWEAFGKVVKSQN